MGAGGLVASVDSLVMREVSRAQLGDARGVHGDSLFCMGWAPVPVVQESAVGGLVVLGSERSVLAESLSGSGCSVEVHADL